MATANYNIPTLDPNGKIDIANDVNTSLEAIDTAMKTEANRVDTGLAGKAPTNHASADTTYGVGSSTQYGHLKLTDDIDAGGAGTVPSATAVNTALQELETSLANAQTARDKIAVFENYQMRTLMICRNQYVLDLSNANLTNNLESQYDGLLFTHYPGIQKTNLFADLNVSATISFPIVLTEQAPAAESFYMNPGVARMITANGKESLPQVQMGRSVQPKAITVNTSSVAGNRLIVNGWTNTALTGGEYGFRKPTSGQIDSAVNWLMSQRGTFTYDNDVYNRTRAAKKATDCSGIIYLAFQAAGLNFVPNYATSQSAYGAVISVAKAQENIDLSKAKKGDILCFCTGDNGAIVGHVAMCTADGGTFWHQNSSYNNNPGTALGPQPLNTPESFRNDVARFLVRWTDDAK